MWCGIEEVGREIKTYPTANIPTLGSGGLAPCLKNRPPFRAEKSPTYLGVSSSVLVSWMLWNGLHRRLTEAPQKPQKTPDLADFRVIFILYPRFDSFSRDFEVFFQQLKNTSQGLKRCYRVPWYLRQQGSRRFVEVWVATLQIRPRSPVIFVRFWSYYKAISKPPFPPVSSPTPS